jgi:anthranilate phosphoribosyltransferase
LKALLLGQHDDYRDIVLFGTAAALIIAGKVPDLRAGVVMATAAIDSGAAQRTLEKLIRITNKG